MVNLFHRHSQGLVSDTLNLKFHLLASIHVNIPTYSEQVKIANFFQTVDEEIKSIETKLDVLKKQKQGLMQLLLTGSIRVKVGHEV